MQFFFLNGCAEEYGKLPVHTPNQLEENMLESELRVTLSASGAAPRRYYRQMFAVEERKCINCKKHLYFYLLKCELLVNELDSGLFWAMK